MRYDGTMLMTDRLEECQRFYAALLMVEPEEIGRAHV